MEQEIAQRDIVPVIGMGITMPFGMSGADCRPGTICEVVLVKSGPNKGNVARIGVQMDRVEHVGGDYMRGTQEVKITQDPSAPVEYFTLRKDGKWRMVEHGHRISIGHRHYAQDVHF